jgi:N-acetylglucosamine-6-sulfatase
MVPGTPRRRRVTPLSRQAATVVTLTVIFVLLESWRHDWSERGVQSQAVSELRLVPQPGATPRRIVFILADDHRYDAMGFMGHPFIRTTNMDRLARGGAHLRNAFVTTALCSPSRATILTGLYAHQHRVVDNNNPVPPGTVFFPQYLQRAGYDTAFIGKWHMGGEGDDPQPGFDRWVSFRGQGTYLPSKDGLNVDGRRVPQKGYISDELTDYAVEWLRARPAEKPFFLYLSHKGVHADFVPATRHRGRYADATVTPPPSQRFPPELEARRPMWVRNQRNSWHGIDFPYHGKLDVADYYRRYGETLLGVDDSIGRVMDLLAERGWLESTLIVYMGDNGFAFGEHGLIDKRTAYETSMRVPMLMHCPQLFPGGKTVTEVVANLDVAPTLLSAAGLTAPATMVGRDMLPLAQGRRVPWRDALLYEYYWERNFPQTPTTFALRDARYKFIRYHGLWDVDELFDLEADPAEMRNLIDDSAHAERARAMSARMFAVLAETNGLSIPLWPDRAQSRTFEDGSARAPTREQQNLRSPGATRAADFPPALIARPTP